ncbi:bifunctional hydroxymethylpyrimidine kinase/phosphomethylpyrimidine kinase [Mesorhizobium sp. M0830]|uniref:bifunctional hydroxymethylpyrimidine kinase/phosphomethylpyrimidine kinase n=1 Tax=Mesorhizobium sp. M0830 TaxID=2957008 RepID=UPI00333CED62
MALGREPHLLVVAGSDSRGGAGIAREIETIACLGVRTCLAVSALTVQTHEDALEIQVTQPGLVADQMRATLQPNRVAATNIGMLATAEIDRRCGCRCAARISAHTDNPDPVLLPRQAERFLKQALFRIIN